MPFLLLIQTPASSKQHISSIYFTLNFYIYVCVFSVFPIFFYFFYFLDLAKLESEIQIKILISQINELKKQKETEVCNIKIEANSIENLLKSSYKEEIQQYRTQNNLIVDNLKVELRNEQSRKQQLQAHLIESEKQLLYRIQLLEEKLVILLARTEQAELEATKLKMESLHNTVSYPL